MRPVLITSLAAAFTLAAPVGAHVVADATRTLSPALSQALQESFTADAAFIRRSKLKKRPSIGYKAVVVVGFDASDPNDTEVDSVDVGLSVEGASPTITGNYRRKTDVHYSGSTSGHETGHWLFSITVDNGDGTSTVAEVLVPDEDLDPTVVGSETTVVTDVQGVKANLRVLSLDGRIKVRVFNEDRDWDASIVSDVTVDGTPIPYVRTTQRFVANVDESSLPADFDDGASYTMSVTAKDAAGNVVDTSTATQVVGSDPVGPALDRVRVKTTNSGAVKVITTHDGFDGGSTALQVFVTDDEGVTVLSSLDDMSASASRLYGMDTLTFEDPAAAADEPYELVISAYDESGAVLGATSVEAVVQGLATGDVSVGWDGMPITMIVDDSEITGRLVLAQRDATNFVLAVALSSDKAARVDIELIDLVGNPAIPESVSLETLDEARRWVSKSSGYTYEAGTALDVTVNLLDENDMPIGSVSGSVNAVPQNAYNRGSGNGGTGGVWVRNWRYSVSRVIVP